MKPGAAKLESLVNSHEGEAVEALSKMISIKAVSPYAGGPGEKERADFLQELLDLWGLKPRRFDYVDDSGIVRSNVVAKFGSEKRTLWIVAHVDTVSEGDLSLWKTDPYIAHVENGRVYGRGSSDDGQEVVAGMYALRVVKESGLELRYNIGIALVADEEVGSRFGIIKLLEEGIFAENDLFIVPDSGSKDGSEIEVAEKGILWLKITVRGKQVHASTPQLGINAFRESAKLVSMIDGSLHLKYGARDAKFDPEISTFEMTRHEKNVDSINIVPGKETFYMDCRILPGYRVEDVLNDVKNVAAAVAVKGIAIDVEPVSIVEPSETRENAEVVKELSAAIRDIAKVEPRLIGIGGGTCAAYLRQKGMDAAVWTTEDPVAHQPNEYAVISNMMKDALTFAYMCVR